MHFLKFLVALVAIFLTGPRTASAAIERLPIGSAESLVKDTQARAGEVHIHIFGERPGGSFMGQMYNDWFRSRTLPDGREESINELGRRSLTELEAFIGEEIKRGVEKSIMTADNAQKLVGNRLSAIYTLKTELTAFPDKGGHTLIRDYYRSDVFQTAPTLGDIPPKLYRVNLVESAKWLADKQTYPLTVQGIDRAQMTEEDENGNTIKITDSVKATLTDIFRTVNGAVDYPLVYHEDDTLFVPFFFALSGKGTLRIWYRDGSEQVFRRQDGEGLITYLSPLVPFPAKRLGVPKVTEKGIELPYEATDDEQVLIKRASPDFTVWEPLYSLPVYPPIVPTGTRPASDSLPVRIRTATAPREGDSGFYQAEVISPAVLQAAQQP